MSEIAIGTSTCTAGALVRRHVRAALDALGITWTEHKAWTESTFVIRGTEVQLRDFYRWMEQFA